MSRPASRIVALIGFMGAGKSTVGRILARRLGLEFVDLDDLIVERAGHSIAAIFETDGEAAFRRLETECLLSQAGTRPHVLATGGGAPERPENQVFFRATARTFYLEIPFVEVPRRTVNDGSRPLLAGPAALLRALYDRRLPIYEALGEKVETLGRTPEEVAAVILDLLRGPRPVTRPRRPSRPGSGG